jgi:hypothetical protein
MNKLFFIFLLVSGTHTYFLKSMNQKNFFENIKIVKKKNSLIFNDTKTKESFEYDNMNKQNIDTAPTQSFIKNNNGSLYKSNIGCPEFKSSQLLELWKHPEKRKDFIETRIQYQNNNNKTWGKIIANLFCFPCDIGKSCIEVTCNCLAEGCVLCGKCIQTTCQNCCEITKDSCCCCFKKNNLSGIDEKFLNNESDLKISSLQIQK